MYAAMCTFCTLQHAVARKAHWLVLYILYVFIPSYNFILSEAYDVCVFGVYTHMYTYIYVLYKYTLNQKSRGSVY